MVITTCRLGLRLLPRPQDGSGRACQQTHLLCGRFRRFTSHTVPHESDDRYRTEQSSVCRNRATAVSLERTLAGPSPCRNGWRQCSVGSRSNLVGAREMNTVKPTFSVSGTVACAIFGSGIAAQRSACFTTGLHMPAWRRSGVSAGLPLSVSNSHRRLARRHWRNPLYSEPTADQGGAARQDATLDVAPAHSANRVSELVLCMSKGGWEINR